MFGANHGLEDRASGFESDAAAEALRAGLVDDSTLVLVDAGGRVSTLTRGANVLEAAADLDAHLDLTTLREVAAGTCSETGRWPALEYGAVTWMPWTVCADFVRCAPPRPTVSQRRPVGLRVSFTIHGALTSAMDRATTLVDSQSIVQPHGPSKHEDHGQAGFARGVTTTTAPSAIADADAMDLPIASRRVVGLLSLLLTLRFDPRAVARERLAQSLTFRRDSTPIGEDIVDALGADTARALVCEGAP